MRARRRRPLAGPLAPAPVDDVAFTPSPLSVPPFTIINDTVGDDRGRELHAPPAALEIAMALNDPRPLEPAAFDTLVDAAARQRHAAAGATALNAGLDLQGLCRFAAGAVAAGERRHVEAQLASTPWATARVAALIRGARGTAHGGLAKALLDGARRGRVDAAVEVGRALLRERNRSDDATADADPDPRVRAGRALSRGRYDEASQALAKVTEDSDLLKIAKKVAQLERDPDLALCEVLDVL